MLCYKNMRLLLRSFNTVPEKNILATNLLFLNDRYVCTYKFPVTYKHIIVLYSIYTRLVLYTLSAMLTSFNVMIKLKILKINSIICTTHFVKKRFESIYRNIGRSQKLRERGFRPLDLR